MPGPYSSDLSYECAVEQCDNLNIELKVLPINSLFTLAASEAKLALGHEFAGITLENLQSRLRGALIYGQSNQTGAMVINTSNKSELAVGYSTQYGDSVGAISLLGALYKSEVFQMAAYLNRILPGSIPEKVIQRPPSAELRENQKDEDSLPAYNRLDPILELFLTTQVVLVDFDKDYELVITAVKYGIKEVLKWPVENNDLSNALAKISLNTNNRANSDGFLKLFSFLSENEDEEDKLFGRIDSYLTGSQESLPFLVYSFPISNNRKDSKGTYRFHWHKSKFFKNYPYKDPSEMVGDMEVNRLITGLADYICIPDMKNNKHKVFISLGAKEKQFLVGAFVIDSKSFIENQLLFSLFVKHVRVSYRHVEALRIEKKLASLAHTDDVTGLFNQRKLNDDLIEVINSSKKKGQEFSLIFIDLDHFKEVNDTYGHRIGSLLLKEVAYIFKKALRETDLVYRYGGDEFIIIIPNSDIVPGLSMRIGERLLGLIKKTMFKPVPDLDVKLSASIGVADFPQHAQTKEQMIEIADKMMYCAKEKGRGQVCHADKLLAS
jgi:NAD+ synthetase